MTGQQSDANTSKRRAFLKSTGALAIASAFAGCSGDDGGDGGGNDGGGDTTGDSLPTYENEAGVKVGETFEAVKELAKDEGQITVYATQDREEWSTWMEGLQDKYPQVDSPNHITGGSEDLISKWDSEYSTDNVQASIYISTSKIRRTWENDQTMELSEEILPNFGEAPDKFKSNNGDWIGIRQVLGNIFYNTDKVSEGDASTWMDIVSDDQWSGQKIGWDPTPNMFLMTWLEETQGREFFEKLADQQPRFVDSHTDLARFTGAGEFPVAFTYTHKMSDFGNELPVDYFKFDPTPSVVSPAVINNKSPQPNSAILLVNWLTSAEGQKQIGAGGYVPWHPDAGFQGYEGVYPSDEYEVDTITPDDADIEATQQMWSEVMGDQTGGN